MTTPPNTPFPSWRETLKNRIIELIADPKEWESVSLNVKCAFDIAFSEALTHQIDEVIAEVEKMSTPALAGKQGDEVVCSNCGDDLSLETYEWFDKGYELARDDLSHSLRLKYQGKDKKI